MTQRMILVAALAASCDAGAPIAWPPASTAAPSVDLRPVASRPASEPPKPTLENEVVATSAPEAPRVRPRPRPREVRVDGPADPRCPDGFFVESCIHGGMPLRTPDGRVVGNVSCTSTCQPRPPGGGPAMRCARTGARSFRCDGFAP